MNNCNSHSLSLYAAIGLRHFLLLLVICLMPQAAQASSETFQDCTECPVMVVIPAGQFEMGAPVNEHLRQTCEGPVHRVSFQKPFAFSKFEITWHEWEACVKEKVCAPGRDDGFGRNRHPVINVSWHDANAYANWLSKKTGQKYRLPSEAEWEYVARAGTSTSRHWGDSEAESCLFANVFNAAFAPYKGMKWHWESFACNDGAQETMPVGQLLPNAFGVNDILGNVREWTADCYVENYLDAPPDGRSREATDCKYRVTRGGSWVTEPIYVRSAARYWVEPSNINDDLGVRLVREIQQPPAR